MMQSLNALASRLCEELACAKNGIGPLRLTKGQLFGLFIRKTWLDINNAWHDAPTRTRLAILASLCIAVLLVKDRISARYTSLTRTHGIPLLQKPKGQRRWDFLAMMQEGARRFPNSPYIIRYAGFEQVVYPSTSYNEVKSVDQAHASLMEYFAHCFFEGWYFLGREIGALHGALGVDLRRSLPARVHDRQETAERSFKQVVGPCPEWKSLRLYPTIQNLVAMTNAPALFGPELGTDPRWLNGINMFIYSLMFALFVLSPVPHLLRPLVRFIAFGPNWLLYWRMKRLARRVVERDLLEGKHRVDDKKTMGKTRLGTWIAARYGTEEGTADRLSHDLIVTMFESLPTTTCTLYFILSELALRPDLADELRGEIKEHAVDGKLPETHLVELRKMDSFMREAQRINTFSYLAVFRRLSKPVKLSIGPELPPGSIMCVDAYNLHRSPSRFQDPEVFDAKRFLKMREQEGHQNLHQFSSLDADMASWGGGPQACPGRFFASPSIKIFLTHLLLNYDIKLPDGKGKPHVGTMPNGSVMPDLFARIMFRERVKGG